jgi:DNA-binding CsgD family transcriptional regulator
MKFRNNVDFTYLGHLHHAWYMDDVTDEQEIYPMLDQSSKLDRSSKMIAAKLHIAENTVANHRKNIMRKTNTENVAQLIAFLVRNRII